MSGPRKYVKLPPIEAMQWTGDNFKEIKEFCPSVRPVIGDSHSLIIETLEDGNDSQVPHYASPYDWIVRGSRGEFWPIKPEIFAETYKEMEE
jgi:hypothetical protein